MSTKYRVTAGYVTVETEQPGGGRANVDIRRGAILPADVPAEQIATELRLSTIEVVVEAPAAALEKAQEQEMADVPPPPPPPSNPEPEAVEVPEGMSVATTLEWVGGDVERATAALVAEQAGQNRSTLVDRLTKLIEATAEAAAGEVPGAGADSGASVAA